MLNSGWYKKWRRPKKEGNILFSGGAKPGKLQEAFYFFYDLWQAAGLLAAGGGQCLLAATPAFYQAGDMVPDNLSGIQVLCGCHRLRNPQGHKRFTANI